MWFKHVLHVLFLVVRFLHNRYEKERNKFHLSTDEQIQSPILWTMAEQKICSWAMLPVELVYRILNHLEPSNRILSVYDVCTNLNSYVDHYYPLQVWITFLIRSKSIKLYISDKIDLMPPCCFLALLSFSIDTDNIGHVGKCQCWVPTDISRRCTKEQSSKIMKILISIILTSVAFFRHWSHWILVRIVSQIMDLHIQVNLSKWTL